MSKELVSEFADLMVRSYEYCNNLRKQQVDGKSNCSKCAFHWNYSIRNHGCMLVEMDSADTLWFLENAIDYNGLDSSKIKNLKFDEEE